MANLLARFPDGRRDPPPLPRRRQGAGLLDQDRDHLTSWVHLDREANQRVAEALAERILAGGPAG